MFIERLKKSGVFAIIAALLFPLVAYTVDYVRGRFAEDPTRTLRYWPNWGVSFALATVFALAVLAYTYLVFTAPKRHLWVPIVLIIIPALIFLYRPLTNILPWDINPVSAPPFLTLLHMQLSAAFPNSLLSLSAIIVAFCAIYTLWRALKK